MSLQVKQQLTLELPLQSWHPCNSALQPENHCTKVFQVLGWVLTLIYLSLGFGFWFELVHSFLFVYFGSGFVSLSSFAGSVWLGLVLYVGFFLWGGFGLVFW